jgi:hypothetical protein
MGHGQAECTLKIQASGKRGLIVAHLNMRILTTKLTVLIDGQRAWKIPSIGEDLKAIAYAKHQTPLIDVSLQAGHGRGYFGHGSGTKVVTIRKTTR